MEEKLIYTTYDSFEAEQIIAALASGGIPAYKREQGAGQYVSIFLGRNSLQAVDIIIPAAAEEKAVEILKETGFLQEDVAGDMETE